METVGHSGQAVNCESRVKSRWANPGTMAGYPDFLRAWHDYHPAKYVVQPVVGAGVAARSAATPDPSLSIRNNCITEGESLPGSVQKVQFAVMENARHLVEMYGIDRIGFLTLTMPGGDRVKCIKEAQRRFHSLDNWLDEVFEGKITVWERHQDGTIHFHALVVCPVDIRTGYDWQEGHRKASACKWLRGMWSQLKERLPDFNFGPRHHLEPVKSNARGIAAYLCKYLTKHHWQRRPEDRGARIVRYSGCARESRIVRPQFMWIARIDKNGPGRYRAATDDYYVWNQRTAIWRAGCQVLGRKTGLTMEGLKKFVTTDGKMLGRRWAWKLRDIVNWLGQQEMFEPGSWWSEGLDLSDGYG